MDRYADGLLIRSHSATQDLVLTDGTRGFLSALNITQRTIQPVRSDGETASRLTRLEESSSSMGDVARELNDFFRGSSSAVDEEVLESIREELRDVISDSFNDGCTTRVTYPETLAGHASRVQLATGGAI